MKTKLVFLKKFFIIPIILLTCFSCNYSGQLHQTEDEEIADSVIAEDAYKLTFEELGFSINPPCKMEDVSSQSKSDFLINYGGVENPDNQEKFAAYQMMVTRLPIGYKDLTAKKLAKLKDDLLRKGTKHLNNVQSVRFGYEEYPAYIGYSTHKGLKQKGIMFAKDNLIIALTVMSNYRLEERFNVFTNAFKVLKSPKSQVSRKKTDNAEPIFNKQSLSFGYTVSAPCVLEKQIDPAFDYIYLGVTDKKDADNGKLFKIMVNKLPIPFSSMISSDKTAIKNNLTNYVKQKRSYNKVSPKIKSHLCYEMTYRENGYNLKERLILTNDYVIEMIVASKRDITTDFRKFVNSLKLK